MSRTWGHEDMRTRSIGANLFIICLLFLTISLSGCSNKKNSDTYKIAVAAPQVGPYKALGLSIINGAILAVEKKNISGGINGKKIELINVDDGGLAGEATWKARDLVENMVIGVIGHLNSDISIPASEIYARAKIPQISPGSTSPFFTERKKIKGYVFRTIGRDDDQGTLAAKYALDNGFKKIAILYNNRGYGSSLSSEFIRQIDKRQSSHNVVFYETYKVGECDFSKEVAELKIKTPDFIFFAGEYGDAANFLIKLRSVGSKAVFLGSEGVFDQEFIKTAKENSENALVISLPEINDKSFIQAYRDRFDRELGSYSANSYDATNILINAIEKVRSTNPESIAAELRKVKNYQGLTGKISFNKKGDLAQSNFKIYKVVNGRFI